jgi:hypothetical protein
MNPFVLGCVSVKKVGARCTRVHDYTRRQLAGKPDRAPLPWTAQVQQFPSTGQHDMDGGDPSRKNREHIRIEIESV